MVQHLLEMTRVSGLLKEERGASAVEYGLLIAGIAALVVVAVFALGPVINEAFTDTCSSITSGNASMTATCS